MIRFICFSWFLCCFGFACAGTANAGDTVNFAQENAGPDTLIKLPAQTAATLSLERAVELAAERAPQVEAGQYKQAAAAADRDRAGRLPDPQLQFGVQNLDTQGPGAFNPNGDFMTMQFVGVSQDIPSSAARSAERSKARANEAAAAADTQAARSLAQRSAATAWVDLWAARRANALLEQLSVQNSVAIKAARARLAAAAGSATDVLAARAAGVELDNQIEAVRGDEQEAQAELARWTGSVNSEMALSGPPDFSTLPVRESRLLQTPDQQAPLLAWGPRVKLAEADLRRAEASKQPDWNVGVSYGLRAPGLPPLASVQVGMRVPLFPGHREDKDIDARHADLESVLADREDARRAQIETVKRSLARWQSLNAQIQRDEQILLPLTRDRAETALAAYRGGGSLEPWLEARRAEISANLAYANTLAARARAWAELAYLLPEAAP
ncbi:MAG TPA: TolC family protein [Burkholderiales bacterium]|nr:TolC family protein [Burkholderiales bacterium]